ncbi:uncharacterized protein LOC134843170 [Symsagittifera roscoffensis]|uniref:uncharacterized protein LOC134843170 n=1 Tax=Symsagittifera roscoffensis TaxID=84072 RepID=UPI00307BD3EC
MTHNEKRAHWIKEALLSTGAGVLYGLTSVAVGHPLDTIKTKMQAQKGFEKISMSKSFMEVLRTQGVRGLYRGCIPPLMGSGIYRSLQFSSFETVYTYCEGTWAAKPMPFLPHSSNGGLQSRVLIGGLAASLVRATIETPLEYVKVRRQTGQSWKTMEAFNGYKITWLRTTGLMTTYFVIVDYIRRNHKEFFSRPLLGSFLVSGCAATFAWWVVWPLELMKSQVQGNYGHAKLTLRQRFSIVLKERGGVRGLYRGITPGTYRSLLSNGTSFVVMGYAQRKITQLGLRD